MTWSELKKDKVYRSENFSAVYKVLHLSHEYAMILYYEVNHKVAVLKYVNKDSDFSDWFEVENLVL